MNTEYLSAQCAFCGTGWKLKDMVTVSLATNGMIQENYTQWVYLHKMCVEKAFPKVGVFDPDIIEVETQ